MESPVLRQLHREFEQRGDPLERLIKIAQLFCDDRITLPAFASERQRIYDRREPGGDDDAYLAADTHVRACLHDYRASHDPFRLKLDLAPVIDDHFDES